MRSLLLEMLHTRDKAGKILALQTIGRFGAEASAALPVVDVFDGDGDVDLAREARVAAARIKHE
jgi:hypothetical protein